MEHGLDKSGVCAPLPREVGFFLNDYFKALSWLGPPAAAACMVCISTLLIEK